MSEPIPFPEPVPYQIRVGVTGHVELADPEALRRKFVATFQRIEAMLCEADRIPYGRNARRDGIVPAVNAFAQRVIRLPGVFWRRERRETPIQWLGVSSMAPGADQELARALLDRSQGMSFDAELDIVLPLHLEQLAPEYDNYPSAWDYLNERLAQATHVRAPERDSREEMHDAFRAAGRTVASHADLFFAVWDGRWPEHDWGTADAVRHALDIGMTVFWIDANNPSVEIRLLRKHGEQTLGGDWRASTIDGVEVLERAFPDKVIDLLPEFLELAAYNRARLRQHRKFSDSYRYFVEALDTPTAPQRLDSAETGELSARLRDEIIKRFAAPFAMADHLAQRHQSFHKSFTISLFLMAALAVGCAACQIIVYPAQMWLIVVEIGLLFLVLTVLYICHLEGWHTRWLNYRHLAERLRSLSFVWLVDCYSEEDNRLLPEPGDYRQHGRAIEEALGFYKGPGDWVSRATAHARSQPAQDATRELCQRVAVLGPYVARAWLRNQAQWHHRNAARREHFAHRMEAAAVALFVTTLIGAFLHVNHYGEDMPLPEFSTAHAAAKAGDSDGYPSATVGSVISFIAVFFPACAAAIHGILSLLEPERIAARSHQMSLLMERFAYEAESAASPTALQDVVRRAYHLTAMENAEWHASSSFRKPTLPG